MGKEAVAWRDVREPALLRRPVDAHRRVEPHIPAEPDGPFLRTIQTRETTQNGGLSRSRRAKQNHHATVAGVERQVGAQADGRGVPPEKRGYEWTGHARPERRCRR